MIALFEALVLLVVTAVYLVVTIVALEDWLRESHPRLFAAALAAALITAAGICARIIL